MATILSNIDGSPLMNSPIMAHIKADVLASTDDNPISFHRVVYVVTADLQGGSNIELQDSTPAESGETIDVDISSALRTAADAYEFTPDPPSSGYPYVSFSLKAWDEWMQNGEVHDTKINAATHKGGRALMGGYSDLERLLSGGSKMAGKFTRKPSTMAEVVCDGETYIRPQEMSGITIGNVTHGPISATYSIKIDKDNPQGLRTVGGVSLYVIPMRPDRYQFRFINGLGCMESIGVFSLRQTSVDVTSNEYAVSRQETFGKFTRNILEKQNDIETWKMSSGPVDERWQSWFLHEFLMAKHAWINIGGHWIPCNIKPDDNVSGMNRQDASLLEVQFSVKLDISGSLLLAI